MGSDSEAGAESSIASDRHPPLHQGHTFGMFREDRNKGHVKKTGAFYYPCVAPSLRDVGVMAPCAS